MPHIILVAAKNAVKSTPLTLITAIRELYITPPIEAVY